MSDAHTRRGSRCSRDETRDLHLTDADPCGDVALCPSVVEAHPHDPLLPLREQREQALDRHAVVDRVEARIALTARPLGLAARISVERRQPVERAGFHALDHVLLPNRDALGELPRGRRPPELLVQDRRGITHREVQLLDPTRHAHRPAAIPEVPLELTQDRRGRERAETHAMIGIEALDGLQQTHHRDLAQVLERLATVHHAPRQRLGQPRVLRDQLVAERALTRPAILAEPLDAEVVIGHGHRAITALIDGQRHASVGRRT